MTIKHYADDETGQTIIATDPMHSDGGVRLNDSPVGEKKVTAPHRDQDSAEALRAYFRRDAGEALRERVVEVIRLSKLAGPAWVSKRSFDQFDALVDEAADAVLAAIREGQ